MGGGLLQLVAYGAQDVYLTGNPQITFFKVVYRRHTNFAVEAIVQTVNGTFGYGNTVTCQISRNGDLINRVYLQVKLPKLRDVKYSSTLISTYEAGARYVNYIGLRLLKSVTIEIGGQQIDKHYSDWLYIWNELSLPRGKRYAYDTMVGADRDITWVNDTNLNIPLEFWFCRNVGLALPLIALQYHEVKINIQFEDKVNCFTSYDADGANVDERYSAITANHNTVLPNITECALWVDYIFLDTDERRRFAQLSHEYLIEQLQFTGTETLNNSTSSVTNNRIKLSFNHPCKELVWVAKPSNFVKASSSWYNYTETDRVDSSKTTLSSAPYNNSVGIDETFFQTSNYMIGARADPFLTTSSSPFVDAILQLNGNDRFSVREATYFSYVQPYQHHTNIPSNGGIHVYSFALKPEEHQPSGTLNMSRIDTATLMVNVKSGLYTAYTGGITKTEFSGINIYAVNYNVLRILSGMGGLAYSN
jgi:hypothetical protein